MSSSWRIDPDEPYRYECPDCGTRSLEHNIRANPYCHGCQERKAWIIDLKDNTKVFP